MDYCKICESGGTEVAIFLNILSFKCICLMSTAMYLSWQILYKMSDIVFAVFTCAQLSLWVSIVHLYAELCPESTHTHRHLAL